MDGFSPERNLNLLRRIRGHVPEAGTTPLCGNSIGTDRRFLAQYLREIDDYLHYRSIDVSSLKELCLFIKALDRGQFLLAP